MTYHILVCDDAEDIRTSLAIYLKSEGYAVHGAETGRQALDVLEQEDIHLVIMDVMMPDMDGITATARIREKRNIPIIMLSAKTEDTDKVLGLNVGADDYVAKPFNPVELLARVRSQLRRFTDLGGLPKTVHQYRVGGITLDDACKSVSVDGRQVQLTPNEYGILLLLIRHPGHVFSSERIYEAVWGEQAFDVKKTVSVHMSHLRDKLEVNPSEPDYIKTVYGMGYRLVGDRR